MTGLVLLALTLLVLGVCWIIWPSDLYDEFQDGYP